MSKAGGRTHYILLPRRVLWLERSNYDFFMMTEYASKPIKHMYATSLSMIIEPYADTHDVATT